MMPLCPIGTLKRKDYCSARMITGPDMGRPANNAMKYYLNIKI